jgi:hypothetical protein
VLKYLRIAVSALSLTACVLLIALWVNSRLPLRLPFVLFQTPKITPSPALPARGREPDCLFIFSLCPSDITWAPPRSDSNGILPPRRESPEPPQPAPWRMTFRRIGLFNPMLMALTESAIQSD